MTAPNVVADDTTTGAADKAASGASGTEADKAIADKAAQDALAAQWKAPENKEAFDKAISDAVEAAKPKAPDKYDLKAPDKITVDPALIERTAATARSLGLSQEAAQKTVEFVAQELAAHTAMVEQIDERTRQPGTAEWNAATAHYKGLALADPSIGNGKPEVLDQKMALVKKVVARFGTEEFAKRVEVDPITWHPEFLKFVANIGNAMSEKALVMPTGKAAEERIPTAQLFYPKGAGRTEEEVKADQTA